MENDNKRRYIANLGVIILVILIVIILVITANFLIFGIFALLDPETGKTISEVRPLMNQYIEEKYDGKMRLDRVSATVSNSCLV